MENLFCSRLLKLKFTGYLILALLLSGFSIAFAADKDTLNKGDTTTDGLTITKSTRVTQTEIKKGIVWSEYTKYKITPVEVSFRKNWQKDHNQRQVSLSQQVTEKDMAGIRESIGKIAYEELDKALQKKGNLTKTDTDDSKTLLFKFKVINLDIYAPEVLSSQLTIHYIRQAGKATLFLEVYDAVSGEILGRWVDTREDPDRGYFDWANRITNNERMRIVIITWANRLVEGLDKLEAEK
jgi:hypothetical protein